MSTVRAPTGQRLLLRDVDWPTYTRLLRAFDERPAVRLTYDRGTLEIMTLTHEHESDNRFLGRLVVVLTEELGMPVRDGGSTTIRRRKRRRGLEPDTCFWIAHEPAVRSRQRIDLRIDPPPDLAIETDVTHSSLDRLAIYAALQVPEVWRLAGGVVVFHVLQPNGQYAPQAHSLAFPLVTAADLTSFLSLRRGQMDDNAVVRQFRTWVRQRMTAGGSPP